MKNRGLKIVALLAVLFLACGAGTVLGGGIVYGLTGRDGALSFFAGDGTPTVTIVLPADSPPRQLPVGSALVVEVVDGSPAEEAGLQVGDAILAVDGQEIGLESNLADLIAGYQPGDQVALEVERTEDEMLEVTVELGEHPDQDETAYLGVRYTSLSGPTGSRTGMFFITPGGAIDLEGHLPEWFEMQGALVQRVTADSPAEQAGLETGSVITAIDGESVENAAALVETIAGHEPGDRVTLTVLLPGDEDVQDVEVVLGEHPDEAGQAYLGVEIGTINLQRVEPEGPGGFWFREFDRQPGRFQWPWSEDA